MTARFRRTCSLGSSSPTHCTITPPPTPSISGLQGALDGKVDDSQVQTNVPAGAVFTDTVYTHPSSHPISLITGLQAALDGKVDDSQVQTNVPAGAVFTDTVYTHPSSHPISLITGLQAALDGKQALLTAGSVPQSNVANLTTDLSTINAAITAAATEIHLGGTTYSPQTNFQ